MKTPRSCSHQLSPRCHSEKQVPAAGDREQPAAHLDGENDTQETRPGPDKAQLLEPHASLGAGPSSSEISLKIDGKTEAGECNAQQRLRQDLLPPLPAPGLTPFPPAGPGLWRGSRGAGPSLLPGRTHHLGLLTYKAMLMTAPARRASVSIKPGQELGGVPALAGVLCGGRPKRRPSSTSGPDVRHHRARNGLTTGSPSHSAPSGQAPWPNDPPRQGDWVRFLLIPEYGVSASTSPQNYSNKPIISARRNQEAPHLLDVTKPDSHRSWSLTLLLRGLLSPPLGCEYM